MDHMKFLLPYVKDIKKEPHQITVTGGVLSLAKSGDNPQFTQEEANAVVAAAKDYGFGCSPRTWCQGMKRAIKAGVDSIEHGTYMDDEAMDSMIKTEPITYLRYLL